MTESLLRDLLDTAVAATGNLMDREAVVRAVSSDSLGVPDLVHDWRNHIPEEVAKRWGQLSEEARLVAFFAAALAAAGEEWE